MIVKLSDNCFSCLAKFSSSFSHSPLKIILKQLFTSGSVNIAEYLPRLRLGKYSVNNTHFVSHYSSALKLSKAIFIRLKGAILP